MNNHFNKLTPAELERIALLSEEMGEVQQVLGKILRHGYASHWEDGPTNRFSLNVELADVLTIIDLMLAGNDISQTLIDLNITAKKNKIQQFLHHQEDVKWP